MNFKIPDLLTKFIAISLIMVGIIYVTRLVELNNTCPEVSYQEMDTADLQKEVERLSQNGVLPFPMGMELMKRWAQR